RYGRGDEPLTVRFTADEPNVLYEDVMGEFDMRVLAADLAHAGPTSEITTPIALGWGGDRFRTYETPNGSAMVWYVIWDDVASRFRFLATTGQRLESRRKLGYSLEITSSTIGGRPATRIVIAPEKWSGWKSLPTVTVTPE